MNFDNPIQIIIEDVDGKQETFNNVVKLVVSNEYSYSNKKMMSIDLSIINDNKIETKSCYRVNKVYNSNNEKIKRKYLKKGNTINVPYSGRVSFENKIKELFDV